MGFRGLFRHSTVNRSAIFFWVWKGDRSAGKGPFKKLPFLQELFESIIQKVDCDVFDTVPEAPFVT